MVALQMGQAYPTYSLQVKKNPRQQKNKLKYFERRQCFAARLYLMDCESIPHFVVFLQTVKQVLE